MKILVTGGAGYIGSHTAKLLKESGHTPVILDNFCEGHRWAVGTNPLAEADLADDVGVRQAIARHGIEAVIHFAAYAYVGESVTDPRKYFHNNVANTLKLLDAMVDSGIKRIVYSSSCATYGIPDRIPIPEEQAQRPVSPYGESKLMVERFLHWYEKAYGLQWVALRYFNAAGASGDLGECHDPETHLIPLAIRAVLTGKPIQVFGTDYATQDGTAVRDYIHVDDLAAAHLLALEYLVRNGASRAFNVGTGEGCSVREVLNMVGEVSRRPVPHEAAARRPGDPPLLVADNRAAQAVLGWSPRKSSLRAIVESAWQWHSKVQGQKTGV